MAPFLALVLANATIVEPAVLTEPVSRDPNDDPFIACALASGCDAIISGDRHLLEISGYERIEVLTPRQLIEVIEQES